MIISVSRRTDIPAFFSEWFFNRLKEGYVLVRNPMNYRQVSKISLNTDVVDLFVFWTKNPRNMMDKLHLLDKYKYYFQFTLNPYDKEIEKGVPKKKEIIDTFKELSNKIGQNRVIWRYDPIIITDKMNEEYHYKYFEYLAKNLEGYTNKCIISFLDMYKKTKRNVKYLNIKEIDDSTMERMAKNLVNIGNKYGITIESCSEKIELSHVGVSHGKCIDDNLISEILGIDLRLKKDKNQREECGCVVSIDIGAYNTCMHNCSYCYANFSEKSMKDNNKKHNVNSSFLVGELESDDKVYERKMESYKIKQLSIR